MLFARRHARGLALVLTGAFAAIHTPAFAADYLCSFQSSLPNSGYADSHVFTTDVADDAPLICGQVEARRETLSAYHLLQHGQMTVAWGGISQTLDRGYFQVRIDRVSRADGGPCSLEMEVKLSGTPLYRGAPLAVFGASSTGSDGSSGVAQLRWATAADGQLFALIDRSVSLASFSGGAAFSCARIN